MAEFDISFKALSERSPRLVVILFGHGRIGDDAVVRPVDRELAVPVTAVDQAFIVEYGGKSWIVHLEAEVGLSVQDRKAIVKRSNMLDAKYDLPVWTTIVLMSPRRGPAEPPKTLTYRSGSKMNTVRPRYVKLWQFPAKKLFEAGVTALPWIAVAKASREEMETAIEQVRAVEDRELREQLSAEMTALSYLQYDEDVVGSIRRRLGMATSKQILEATPLAEEFRQYGRREGREEGRREGRKEERENSRRRLLNALEDAIASRAPGADAGWLRDIRDMDQLERIHREVLRAEDARALRNVLSRHAAQR